MKSNRFTIAHILHSFGTGGMEKGVATLVSNASSDINHIIICLTRSGKSERLLPQDTEVIELDKAPGNSIHFHLELAKLLRKIDPDLIHTRNWGGTDGIIAARIAGIRSVVHSEHGFGPDNPDGDNLKRIWIHRMLSFWVNEYVALSRALKGWLLENVAVRKPVTRICNGVNVRQFSPGNGSKLRKKLGLPLGVFVIGIVASLNTIKDHQTLIQAFKLIRSKTPDSALLIVGDGPERKRLEQLSGPGIRFLGNREDVPELMKAFDVFVLSSINEGISNTILEAMATGLPVVASRVGGNPELVVDNITGRLFTAGDSDELAAKILGYASSTDLRMAHGSQGRINAVKHFSIQAMVEQYETIWRRVALS